MRLVTRIAALAALTLLAPLAQAQAVTSSLVNTTTVRTTLYSNGNIGGDCSGTMPAFVFGTDEGLCGAGFLLGISAAEVIGDAYILDTTTEWTPASPFSPSTVFPYAGLNQGVKTSFSNAANNVTVEMNAYYATATPDFVVLHYAITNTGTTALNGVYPGIFADWDVGGAVYAQNLAAFDATTQTIYAWDPTFTSPNYYGVSSLSQATTGWRYDMPYPPASGQPQDEAQFYTGLTSPSTPTSTAQDQRIVQGVGPVAIPAGGTVVSAFAMVAGSSLADFQANVAAARGITVSSQDSPDDADNVLSAPAPNPTTGVAQASLTVQQSQSVRVALYDALGREVALLLDGPVQAGTSETVRVEGLALPAGVYLIRAQGETFIQTQRLVISQ